MTDTIKIIILGGLNEVGGNIVLLEDINYDTKIFIDFVVKIKKYYDSFERGQHPSSIQELIQEGLLPSEENIAIRNLYENKDNSEKIETPTPSNLDGILISHPHKDHYFSLSFVNRTIPIYTGVVTKRIIRAFS